MKKTELLGEMQGGEKKKNIQTHFFEKTCLRLNDNICACAAQGM